jgi:hypothetical protein
MREVLRFIRNLILKNGWLKLSALLLAFALWFMVRSSAGERVFTVPLVVQIPRNMEIVNERPSSVEITTLGAPNLAGGFSNLTYTIDLQSASEGELTIPLSPAGVRVPAAAGFSVIRVSPARVTLVLERVISKDVPVKAVITGNPANGFDLYKATVQPERVRISGPRSEIEPMKEVATQPVSIAGLDHSFQTMVNFDLQNDDIHTSPVAVGVNVEVGVHREAQVFKIPVSVEEADNFVATPNSVSVTVLVPVDLAKEVTAEDFRAVASGHNPEPGTNRIVTKPDVQMTVELDAGIVIKEVRPEEITLHRKTGKK